MKTSKSKYLKLGLIVIAGIAFFVTSVYLLGKQQNLFDATFKITSTFKDVKGLKIGNSVRFSGINVGSVNDIEIINDSLVRVEMILEKDVKKFIQKDSEVEIISEGLLGNKIIKIYQGNVTQSPVEEGENLRSRKTPALEDYIVEARTIIMDSKKMIKNLAEISEKLNHGEGDFSRLLNNNSITTNLQGASHQLSLTSKELHEIIEKVNSGNNDLSKLLNDDSLTTQFRSIMQGMDSVTVNARSITKSLDSAAIQINYGDGLIHKLLYDSTLTQSLDTAMIKINSGIKEAERAAKTIDNSWLLNLFSDN